MKQTSYHSIIPPIPQRLNRRRNVLRIVNGRRAHRIRHEAVSEAITALSASACAHIGGACCDLAAHRLHRKAGARIESRALVTFEQLLLAPEGLMGRPWYRHTIYAPGSYAGYAAVVMPGVNEAIDRQ